MAPTKVAGKSGGAPATLTSLATSYQTAYTPAANDILFAIANGTKAAAGQLSLTNPDPTKWTTIGAGFRDNGGVDCSLYWLMRVADGSANDNAPAITVASATWQWYTTAWSAVDHTVIPKDYTAIPDLGVTSISNTANTGEARTTSTTPGWVYSVFGCRAPATFSTAAFAWGGGATVDLGATGGTNNFMSTGQQSVSSPGTVTPSATWTGGSGTASVIISLGFTPVGASSGTLAKVMASGAPVIVTSKVMVGGVLVAVTNKVMVGGVLV